MSERYESVDVALDAMSDDEGGNGAGLKPPFPWFGGKSRVAHLVWERFGRVSNYCEPFAGSLAVLLNRPHTPGIETVNDLDCYLANFWRATRHDPEAVATWANWPVNEIDLHARHRWLLDRVDFRARMLEDPDYYDAKIAGWWVWGLCSWIGGGWCDERFYAGGESKQLPHLSAGRGVHRPSNAGQHALIAYFGALAERLRLVRVCCGDWMRILGPTPTEKLGLTGVFLDPPYEHSERQADIYAVERDVAQDVRAWAIANGDNPLLRIALCAYESPAYQMPTGWAKVAWKAAGGYGSQGNGPGKANCEREVIWFSPACLGPRQPDLFTMGGTE